MISDRFNPVIAAVHATSKLATNSARRVPDPAKSILAQVRHEAYSEGWSQASQVSHDDAYHKGRLDGLQEAADVAFRWWVFGVLSGIGACTMFRFLFS